jgi:hypothetical protein
VTNINTNMKVKTNHMGNLPRNLLISRCAQSSVLGAREQKNKKQKQKQKQKQQNKNNKNNTKNKRERERERERKNKKPIFQNKHEQHTTRYAVHNHTPQYLPESRSTDITHVVVTEGQASETSVMPAKIAHAISTKNQTGMINFSST